MKIRCPVCKGSAGGWNRFNHFCWDECFYCAGGGVINVELDALCVFSFDVKPKEGCEIHCPECGEWSSHHDWEEAELYCDICGGHIAMKCPKCDEVFDSVFCEMFEVR